MNDSQQRSPALDIGERGFVEIIDEMLHLWAIAPRTPLVLGKPEFEVDSGPIVFGLSAQVHKSAEAARLLYENGLLVEAVPIIRVMYETAWTALWVAQVPDGARALVNEGNAQRRKRLGNLREVQDIGLNMLMPERFLMPREDLPRTPSDASTAFQSRCADLTPGGQNAYMAYRVLCEYSHASVSFVDRFVEIDEGSRRVSRLLREPTHKHLDPEVWLYYAAVSLVWARSSLIFMDRDRTHRSEVRTLARRLDVPWAPEPTWKAQQRASKRARAPRRTA